MPRASSVDQRLRRAAGHVEPDRLAGGRQRRVGQRQAERFGDDLAGGRRAQELAAAAGRCAQAWQPSSAASSSVISPWAKRAPIVCTLPASSPSVGGSVTPPGTRMPGRSRWPASAIIMAGSPLSQVATPSTPRARGQRADQPAQHDGGVVAIGQAVHHAGRALRAAVARVGDKAGEGDGAQPAELLGRGLHQQADLPVAGVVAERDGAAVGRADAALRAEDQELAAAQLGRVPAHAGVLRQAEDGAGGRQAQEFVVERQTAGGAGGVGVDGVNRRVGGIDWVAHACLIPL